MSSQQGHWYSLNHCSWGEPTSHLRSTSKWCFLVTVYTEENMVIQSLTHQWIWDLVSPTPNKDHPCYLYCHSGAARTLHLLSRDFSSGQGWGKIQEILFGHALSVRMEDLSLVLLHPLLVVPDNTKLLILSLVNHHHLVRQLYSLLLTGFLRRHILALSCSYQKPLIYLVCLPTSWNPFQHGFWHWSPVHLPSLESFLFLSGCYCECLFWLPPPWPGRAV